MADPENDPEERLYSGEPLETAEGTRVPRQQPVGPESAGGGEFPDPETPPVLPAPGAAADTSAETPGTPDEQEDPAP
jgi:hypothetical protein